MSPNRPLTCLLVAFLGGCATYQDKPLNPAATLAEWESRRLDDPRLARYLATVGETPNGEWNLARLTLAAFYFQPELEVARAQLAAAEAGIRAAGARPNPTLVFTPGRSDATAGGVSPWILGYALSVPVELAGRRGWRSEEATQRGEVARLELAARAWAAHRAVRRALIDLTGAEAGAELERTLVPLVRQTAGWVAAQVQAGEVAALQAAQAEAAVARAEVAAREAERSVVLARSRLAEAIGVPLVAIASLRIAGSDPVDPTAPMPALAEARTWAALNRADLLAALASYAAAQAALQGEVARQYPDLTLGPGYTLDQGAGKWSLGIAVTLPVLHQNQGPIAVAEAQRTAAAAQFLAVQNRVIGEVERAAADQATARADWEAARALRSNLERQTRICRAQLAAGETSRLDLARAELALAEQARAELATRIRAAHAVGALEDAVQRPLAWREAAWRLSPRPTNP